MAVDPSSAEAVVRPSSLEVQALADLGREAATRSTSAPLPAGDFDQEAYAQEMAEREQKRQLARDEFAESLLRLNVEAYNKGVASATDKDARRSYNTRSIVLLLVVLAVVMMPLVAILLHLDPQAFGAYIAPVTAIAGTVVGYWFGSQDRSAK